MLVSSFFVFIGANSSVKQRSAMRAQRSVEKQSCTMYNVVHQEAYMVHRFALTLQSLREKQKPQAFDCNSYRLPTYTNLSHYLNMALSTSATN